MPRKEKSKHSHDGSNDTIAPRKSYHAISPIGIEDREKPKAAAPQPEKDNCHSRRNLPTITSVTPNRQKSGNIHDMQLTRKGQTPVDPHVYTRSITNVIQKRKDTTTE